MALYLIRPLFNSAAIAGTALSLALSACSSPINADRVIPPSANLNASPQLLYVSTGSIPPGQIGEFTLAGMPVRTIRKGISYPLEMTLDGNGTLYVLNYKFQPTVTEYALGTTAPARTVTRGISRAPLGIGADSKGDLWVLNAGGPLVRYEPGKTTPEFGTYKGLCAGSPSGGPQVLTVDRFGTAYVGTTCGAFSGPFTSVVREYDGSHSVARTIQIPSGVQPLDLETDAVGTLYLEFASYANRRVGISEYDRGMTKPSFTFAVKPTVSQAAPFMSFDSRNRLYLSVGECFGSGHGPTCTSFISVYDAHSSRHVRTIEGSAPNKLFGGTAIDRADNIYALLVSFSGSGGSSIEVYPPGQSQGEAIIRGHKLGNPFIYPP